MATGTIKKPTGETSTTNILSQMTASSGVSLRNASCVRNDAVATITVQFDITTAKTNAQPIATGIPFAPKNDVYAVATYGAGMAPVTFNSSGQLLAGGTGCPTGTWYSVTVTFPI